jgi:polyisoprenoid-binding protein YceI
MSATASKVDVGTYNIDPVHSFVSFAVKYIGGTFRGSFSPVNGSLEVGEDKIELRGTTRPADIKVQNEDFTAHLQSPDFFDAEQAPELNFRSTDFKIDGDRVKVDGELEIRGAKQPVTLEGTIGERVTDAYGKNRVGVVLRGTVDRTAFGINWQVPLPSGEPSLANDVDLEAELFLVKQED